MPRPQNRQGRGGVPGLVCRGGGALAQHEGRHAGARADPFRAHQATDAIRREMTGEVREGEPPPAGCASTALHTTYPPSATRLTSPEVPWLCVPELPQVCLCRWRPAITTGAPRGATASESDSIIRTGALDVNARSLEVCRQFA